MWLLNFLPDWFFIAVALLGVAALAATFLLKFIPFPVLYMYKTPIQLVAVFLIVIGTFMSGVMYNENEWQQKIKELEEKVKISEEKSKEANVEIVTKYKDRVQVVKDTQIVLQERIKEVEKVIDSKCEVAPEAIEIINLAATNKKPKDKK